MIRKTAGGGEDDGERSPCEMPVGGFSSCCRRGLVLPDSPGGTKTGDQGRITGSPNAVFSLHRALRASLLNSAIPESGSSIRVAVLIDEWGVVDGNVWLFGTGKDQELAKTALGIIKSYQFNNLCFAGAPKRVMTYFRR